MTQEWARQQRFLLEQADKVQREAEGAEKARQAKVQAEEERKGERADALLKEATQARWEAERLARRAAYVAAGGDPSVFDKEWPSVLNQLIHEDVSAQQRSPSIYRSRL